MFVLRYVYLLGLVVWLGGMVALGGLAAPAIFEVLVAREGAAGRILAGAVFGETLRRFHLLAYGSGAIMLAALALMALLGPRPARFAVRTSIVAAMLGVALYSGLVLSRRIEAMQHEIGVPVASLPSGDPRRAEFGRLHGLSTGLMAVNVLGGLVLLFWEVRD
jgi:hypothetical protein